jgi:hypothetical protein
MAGQKKGPRPPHGSEPVRSFEDLHCRQSTAFIKTSKDITHVYYSDMF